MRWYGARQRISEGLTRILQKAAEGFGHLDGDPDREHEDGGYS